MATSGVVNAIAAQAQKLAYAYPHAAHEPRARLGAKLAQLRPATSTSCSSPPAAPRPTRTPSSWRASTPAAPRSWPATGATTAPRPGQVATGDPRRWITELGGTAFVRVTDAYPRPARLERGRAALADLEEVIQFEGPHTIAAFILEPVVGTNGILIPPDGYMQGVREICDRHGILLIADEVMTGFGRTGQVVRRRPLGRGARPHDHGQGPDLLLRAARGGGHAPRHRATPSRTQAFFGRLTYNSHPVGCAAALAVIQVYQDRTSSSSGPGHRPGA